MKPDYIVISKKEKPILFELATSLQSSNDESIKRLLAYYQALNPKAID